MMTRPACVAAFFGFGFLALGWAAVIAIDFLNVFDAQGRVTAGLMPLPLLWHELFSEGKVAEKLQWAALATGFLAFGTVALKFREGPLDPFRYRYALMLSFGLLLMLIEDSLNFRHVVVDSYFPIFFGDESTNPRSTHRLIWELSFYSLLSLLMVLPFLAFWRRGIWQGTGLRLLTLGYLVYGLAGFSSAMRRLGDWQERLGHWIIAKLELAELPAWQDSLNRMEYWRQQSPDYTHSLGYLLTDHLIEESVELIAATLLLMGLLILRGQSLANRISPPGLGKNVARGI